MEIGVLNVQGVRVKAVRVIQFVCASGKSFFVILVSFLSNSA